MNFENRKKRDLKLDMIFQLGKEDYSPHLERQVQQRCSQHLSLGVGPEHFGEKLRMAGAAFPLLTDELESGRDKTNNSLEKDEMVHICF